MRYFIIDGYNVIGQNQPNKIGCEIERDNLINQIKNLFFNTSYSFIVVFDSSRSAIKFEKRSGIEIYYSKKGLTADKLIVNLLETKKYDPKLTTVITRDRELSYKCKILGAEIIENFNKIKNKNKIIRKEKITPCLGKKEVDYWLKEFNIEEN